METKVDEIKVELPAQELEQPDTAQPEQKKQSAAKEYVIERMAGLADGTIEPPTRKVGRPRGENYGKGYISRVNPDDPASVARSEAGKKGQQTIQSRIQTEVSRKKYGRIRQADLDQDLAALKQELMTYTYVHKFDQQDTSDFVDLCGSIVEDTIWHRKYPQESANLYDFDVSQEEQQYCSLWPDTAITDVLTMAKYIMAPDRPGLQKLAVKTLDSFLDWSKTQTASDLEAAVNKVKLQLPKVEDGSIYRGPDYDDPRLEPQAPEKPWEDQLAERHQWATLGRGADNYLPRLEAEQERKLREAQEEEARIVQKKQEDYAAALAQQQRQLLGQETYDAIQQALGGGVFGSIPQRR